MATVNIIKDIAVVSLVGDLDHREMVEVKNVVSEILGRGEPWVVLDLGGVEHVNYKALGVLVERRVRLRSCGGDLRLARPSEYLLDILRFARIHDHFEIHASVEDAVDSCLEENQEIILAGQISSRVPILQ